MSFGLVSKDLNCASSPSDCGSLGKSAKSIEPQVIYLEKENGDQDAHSTDRCENRIHHTCKTLGSINFLLFFSRSLWFFSGIIFHLSPMDVWS